MAKLLKISTKVYLPGATGASWKLVASRPYLIAGRMFGGSVEGALEPAPNEPDWWQWPATARVYGGELGNGAPPLVTVRVTPTMLVGKTALPTVYQGHPREITAGGESWDLSAIGEGSGPVLVTEAERIGVGAATAAANAAAGSVAAATADLNAKKAQVDAALVSTAQSLGLVLSAANTVRYTTNAARNAANPPEGTWGWAADVNNYRHRESGAWVSYDPAPGPPDTGGY